MWILGSISVNLPAATGSACPRKAPNFSSCALASLASNIKISKPVFSSTDIHVYIFYKFRNHSPIRNSDLNPIKVHTIHTDTLAMTPTYTMSAHLCKQICTSWRDAHQTTENLDQQDDNLHKINYYTTNIPQCNFTPSIRTPAWPYSFPQSKGNQVNGSNPKRDDR